jgi:hypothetical protein
MAKKVFNMQGGLHSAAAYAGLENKLYGSAKATVDSLVVTPGAGMNVSVSTGDGIISVDAFNGRRIQVTAPETVAVPASDASYNRVDSVIAYIDNAVEPTTSVIDNVNDILKFMVVAGTAAATPTAPSGAAIQAAIGAGNAYMVLADFTTPQNASNLTGVTFINRAPIIKDTSGWRDILETWAYASYSSTSRIGVFTVPAGATDKYNPGMRVMFTQTTGGLKYGIIVDVTSTTVSVFLPNGTSLVNEPVLYPSYSSSKQPLGFPADAALWTVKYTTKTDTSVAATAQAWYKESAAHQIVVGPGSWRLRYKVSVYAQAGAASTNLKMWATLSPQSSIATNTLPTNEEMTMPYYTYDATSNVKRVAFPFVSEATVQLAAQTTYNLFVRMDTAGTLDIRCAADPTMVIEAICNYL